MIGVGATCLLLQGKTFGLKPIAFLLISEAALGQLYTVLIFVPIAIVYAKMIPNNIESTVFALLTGLNVVANYFVNKVWGNAINKMFVGVTKDNLEDLSTLYIISFFLSFVPLLFLIIVPS